MANFHQLTLLRNDVKGWNNWGITLDLTDTDLGGANLCVANLKGADLRGTNFRNADLSGANLCFANLCFANLSGAEPIEANLSSADLLCANLSKADFSGANLSHVNFLGADLTDVSLISAQALYVNFSGAILTGACIQDWNINSGTNLDRVVCDFIYLRGRHQERRPSHPAKIFAPGEFTKLFQKALETVDLIFSDGIDWKAFLQSFQELQQQYTDEAISIQAIEHNRGGALIVRLEVDSTIDKGVIESQAKEFYERELKIVEAKHRDELSAKDVEIICIQKRHNTNLIEVIKTLAKIKINVEATAVSQSNSNSEAFKNEIHGGNFANLANQVNDNARQQAKQYNYESPQKQTQAEAAEEIQRLLKQLEETNPCATDSDQITYVNIGAKPEFKEKLIAAVKAGGESAIDEYVLDAKYLKVVKAIIKGWLEPSR